METKNSIGSIMENNKAPIITIQQFCKEYPWPSEGGMRHYIFNQKKLGLSGAFFKFGRRVLVDPKRFFELIQEISEECERSE